VLLELAGGLVEIGAGRDFKRNLTTTRRAALTQLDREMSELAGEVASVLLLGGDHEADHVGVVIG
jgi:glutathione synthase/RimK-type ligase-like ATP-grasp enzyme